MFYEVIMKKNKQRLTDVSPHAADRLHGEPPLFQDTISSKGVYHFESSHV